MTKNKAVWLSLLLLIALPAIVPSAPVSAAGAQKQLAAPVGQAVPCRDFPQTGKTVGGRFLQYWIANGGLAQQGYPISEPGVEVSDVNGQAYVVQYFERAVFEYHPENQAPHDVLLSLLGRFAYRQRYPDGAPGQVPNQGPGARYFQQTDKWVGGGFLEYWNNNGGLAQQGYPISNEFDEVSPLDGRTYRVQYFERAVFEYHPENQPQHRILLSQLGTFRFQANYPNGMPSDLIIALDCQPEQVADRDGDAIVDDEDACPDDPENINGIFDNDGCSDTIRTLLDLAAEDINNYWAGAFAAADLRYFAPREVVPYTRPIRTVCGPAELNNAFYCGGSHGIYYDINFLQEQLDTDGDFAPVTILAHEWGHLVQANLGILGASHFTIAIELQADCLAGSYARHLIDRAERGEPGLALEEGDIEEGAVALFRAGDDLPWFDPGAHGTPAQRVEAFTIGVEQGAGSCFREE